MSKMKEVATLLEAAALETAQFITDDPAGKWIDKGTLETRIESALIEIVAHMLESEQPQGEGVLTLDPDFAAGTGGYLGRVDD